MVDTNLLLIGGVAVGAWWWLNNRNNSAASTPAQQTPAPPAATPDNPRAGYNVVGVQVDPMPSYVVTPAPPRDDRQSGAPTNGTPYIGSPVPARPPSIASPTPVAPPIVAPTLPYSPRAGGVVEPNVVTPPTAPPLPPPPPMQETELYTTGEYDFNKIPLPGGRR